MRPHVASIQEEACIGCMKCIDVCPTDAIVGAWHQVHTVVPDLCIGCDLCLPPCPVNCIDLVSYERDPATQKSTVIEAKARIQARLKRLEEEAREKEAAALALQSKTPEERKAEIAAAIARKRQKSGKHDDTE